MDQVYLNLYSPVTIAKSKLNDLHLTTEREEYDHNFVFEVRPLTSDRVELVPFIEPTIKRWLGMDFCTLEDVGEWVEKTIRQEPSAMFFAIYSDAPGSHKPTPRKEWEFAGVIALINVHKADMIAEPGHIQIAKPYQRTHVLTHAVGLILHHILDSPIVMTSYRPEVIEAGGCLDISMDGAGKKELGVTKKTLSGSLGLRRCQWFTNSLNDKSRAAALRLGFTFEGLIRNHRLLPDGKEGSRDPRPDSYNPNTRGRDSWLASIIWEDWEGADGKRAHIDSLMSRR
ncbi:hypothetical protein TREMEDRAFT_70975 [Tremella mesenterica DSM 1558]|uniref:uncharacterized protein n=1 Tax=Tremella mesenterica (strain ATCC 24925 / CBS 8224 / DSM 1558 / NBRC 9311 / NRRL Y-6157 / RJB 2259-6 / UBC 559-6) TaxID=578456 RepID=UPI0003F4A62C|nr:uncharacterized protein TREMEDRAFT_70975 [Tremella mesenterica DSM 1558]EIW73481.1 hypothetical protein TREMEDRAFT_70975 [Tremella mesenterica DSM 1558]